MDNTRDSEPATGSASNLACDAADSARAVPNLRVVPRSTPNVARAREQARKIDALVAATLPRTLARAARGARSTAATTPASVLDADVTMAEHLRVMERAQADAVIAARRASGRATTPGSGQVRLSPQPSDDVSEPQVLSERGEDLKQQARRLARLRQRTRLRRLRERQARRRKSAELQQRMAELQTRETEVRRRQQSLDQMQKEAEIADAARANAVRRLKDELRQLEQRRVEWERTSHDARLREQHLGERTLAELEALQHRETEITEQKRGLDQRAAELQAQENRLRAAAQNYEQLVGELVRQQDDADLTPPPPESPPAIRAPAPKPDPADPLEALLRETDAEVDALRRKIADKRASESAMAVRDVQVKDARLAQAEEAQQRRLKAERDKHEQAMAQRRRDTDEECARKLAQLEQQIAARQTAIESELASLRQSHENRLESERREIETQRKALEESSSTLQRDREILARDRAEFDRTSAEANARMDSTIAERVNREVAEQTAPLQARQQQLEVRAQDLERRTETLNKEWERFSKTQSEFDTQQRAWAEQRDGLAATLEKQRAELSELQKALDTRADRLQKQETALAARREERARITPAPAKAPPAPPPERREKSKPSSAAQHRPVERATDARPAPVRTRRALTMAAVVVAAGVIGFAWPPGEHAVVAELAVQASSQKGIRGLRMHEDALLSPSVLRMASVDAGQNDRFLETLLQQDRIKTSLDPTRNVIRVTINASKGDSEDALRWLNAWTHAYLLRHGAAATAPVDEQTQRWKAERDAKAAELERQNAAMKAARDVLDKDPTDAQLQQLRARMSDAQSQYDHDRSEAEKALQAWNREQNATEEDALRLIDPRRLERAQAADSVLKADLDQLTSQCSLLRGELKSAATALAPLFDVIADRIGACEAQAVESSRDATATEVAAAIDAIRSALADYRKLVTDYQTDWQASVAAVESWPDTQDAAALLEIQSRLESRADTFARASRKPVEMISRQLDLIGSGNDDTTRRTVIQNALNKTILPLKQAQSDLLVSGSGLTATGNVRVDAYRRSVRGLSDRIEQRRGDIHAAVAEEVKKEWHEQRDARIAAARLAHEKAVSRREASAEQRDKVTAQIGDWVHRAVELDTKRQDIRSRQQEVDALRQAIAHLDTRIAEAVRTAGPAAEDRVTAGGAVDVSVSLPVRLSRMGIGMTAALALAMAFSFTPRSRRIGTQPALQLR